MWGYSGNSNDRILTIFEYFLLLGLFAFIVNCHNSNEQFYIVLMKLRASHWIIKFTFDNIIVF